MVREIQSLDDLDVREFVATPITKEDLQVKIDLTYIPAQVILEIRPHWRPIIIDVWMASYQQDVFEDDENLTEAEMEQIYDDELEEFIKTLEDGSYIEEYFLYIQTVCNRGGYNLEG